jgi:CBS domain containing-hemolysin-like protein
MTSLYLEIGAIAFCIAFLFFLSLVENSLTQSSPLVLRMTLERGDQGPDSLLPQVLEDQTQFLVPLHLGTQMCSITIAVLITHLSLNRWQSWGVAYSFGMIVLISLVFRQLLPRLFTQNESEKKLVSLLRAARPVYTALRSLALPLSSVLRLFRRLHEEEKTSLESPEAEATDEEIQAYLDIGEDEGILEEEDSKLIQSVVEFGDTLVREVMTPRTAIIACEESATVGELRDVMVRYRHSRIPIYRGDIDHIIGIAYIRQLLAQYSQAGESDPITGLIHPALFVPETKPVSQLLRELQERGDHTAIAIDEFGGVAGLVTIEDILEEIVGEIRDEDQAKVSEIVEETPGTYVMRGSTEIYRLEEVSGEKFEAVHGSTVAGLVTSYLGRVPAPGEEFDIAGLRIRVLDADRRRVLRVRVQARALQQDGGSDNRAAPSLSDN